MTAIDQALRRSRQLSRWCFVLLGVLLVANGIFVLLVMRSAWQQWLVAPIGPAAGFFLGKTSARLRIAHRQLADAFDAERARIAAERARLAQRREAEEELYRRSSLGLALGSARRGGDA